MEMLTKSEIYTVVWNKTSFINFSHKVYWY